MLSWHTCINNHKKKLINIEIISWLSINSTHFRGPFFDTRSKICWESSIKILDVRYEKKNFFEFRTGF